MSNPEPLPPAVTDMRQLFELAFAQKASDIHLTENSSPILRIFGDLIPTPFAPVTPWSR